MWPARRLLTLVSRKGAIVQSAGAIISATSTITPVTVSLTAASGITAAGMIFSGAAQYPSGKTPALGTLVLSTTTGNITQTGTDSSLTGLVAANLLNANPGAGAGAGSVLLNNKGTTSPGNQIVNLGTSNAGTGFALIDFRDLTVKGTVASTNGSVAITTHAGVTGHPQLIARQPNEQFYDPGAHGRDSER